MHNKIFLISALGLIAACTATAQAPPEVSEPSAVSPASALESPIDDAPSYAAHETPFTCEVRARRTANGVLVTGFVEADGPLAGEYDMVIAKYGGGNSSDIAQSGPFAVGADGFAALGESEIALERGARLRVTLTLTTDDGRTCRRVFRS